METEKKKMGRYTITDCTGKRGETSYRVSWWDGRKHKSKSFESAEERMRWVNARRGDERTIRGIQRTAQRAGEYVSRFSHLPVETQGMLLTMLDLAAENGTGVGDLHQAVAQYFAGQGGGHTVGEGIAAHIADKRAEGRRAATIRERSRYLRLFREGHGAYALGRVTRGMCRDWITEAPTLPARAHRHAALSAFFNYCVQRDWIQRSPMTGLRKSSWVPRENVPIFTAEQAERLLRSAEKVAPRMVPYFAIGIFGGLRPENEIKGLLERDIDLENCTIWVSRHNVKTGQARSTPISPNLKAWLSAYPVGADGIYFSRWSYLAVREAAKVEWAPDIMRHTRASYRLAQTRDPHRVADENGHSVAVLKSHYANRRIPPAEVDAFWGIMPSKRLGVEEAKA